MEKAEFIDKNYLGYVKKTRPGCRAIIIKDGKMLLSCLTKYSYCMIPGGGKEENESLEECCRREIEEETGLLIEVGEPQLQIDEYFTTEHVINTYFLGKVVGEGKQRLTEDEIKAGLAPSWVSIEEALALFGKYEGYKPEFEIISNLYRREYTALVKVLKREK